MKLKKEREKKVPFPPLPPRTPIPLSLQKEGKKKEYKL
jgi:hypothetical protein